MAKTKNGSIELEFETFGDAHAEPVLLVHGLGAQMTRFSENFCGALVAQGHRVIRFDNRDSGLSTWPNEPYTLSDMADDAVAVLDAAGVERAHVVGTSMGGAIAQRLAIDHPDRAASLTLIMSFTGATETTKSAPEAAAVLSVAGPDPRDDFEAYVAHAMKNMRLVGGTDHRWSEAAARQRIETEYRRAYNPAGIGRQMRAVQMDGDRAGALRSLKIPTVVVHGEADTLIMPIGGIALARAIPDAELRLIPGMGHDMPPSVWPMVLDAIGTAVTRSKMTSHKGAESLSNQSTP